MLDFESIMTTIVTGLRKHLKIAVISSNQTGDIPSYPYLSYTLRTPSKGSHGTWGEYEDGVHRRPVTQTWSITVQSDNMLEALQLAVKAQEWFDHTGTTYLNDNNIIVVRVTDVTSRDNLISIEYEYRNGFDVVIWLLSEDATAGDSAGTIEQATIQHDESEVS